MLLECSGECGRRMHGACIGLSRTPIANNDYLTITCPPCAIKNQSLLKTAAAMKTIESEFELQRDMLGEIKMKLLSLSNRMQLSEEHVSEMERSMTQQIDDGTTTSINNLRDIMITRFRDLRDSLPELLSPADNTPDTGKRLDSVDARLTKVEESLTTMSSLLRGDIDELPTLIQKIVSTELALLQNRPCQRDTSDNVANDRSKATSTDAAQHESAENTAREKSAKKVGKKKKKKANTANGQPNTQDAPLDEGLAVVEEPHAPSARESDESMQLAPDPVQPQLPADGGTESSQSEPEMTAKNSHAWIYVSGFTTSTTAAQVRNYAKSRFKCDVTECTLLLPRGVNPTSRRSLAFKLKVPAHAAIDAMNPSMWPAQVFVRSFVSNQDFLIVRQRQTSQLTQPKQMSTQVSSLQQPRQHSRQPPSARQPPPIQKQQHQQVQHQQAQPQPRRHRHHQQPACNPALIPCQCQCKCGKAPASTM